jgi:hypothetical protein
MNEEVKQIRKIAKDCGFKEKNHIARQKIISFVNKNNTKIDIYYSKMTIGLTFVHPREGKKQVFKKNISLNKLKKIFNNPLLYSVECYETWVEGHMERVIRYNCAHMMLEEQYAEHKIEQYQKDLRLKQKQERDEIIQLQKELESYEARGGR